MKTTVWIAILATGSMSGCDTIAPQARLDDVSKRFGTVVSDSTSVVTAEINAKIAVRRDEIVMYYLLHPRDATNLTSDGKPRSFANFVCAGRGSLGGQTAGLEYLKAYSDSASDIIKPGGDTLAEQWKKAKSLSAKPEKLTASTPAENPKSAVDGCVAQVVPTLSFEGVSATDFSNESPLAVIEGLAGLLKTLETVAKDTLKGSNELLARRRFSELVEQQHDDFRVRLANYIDPDKLDNAWTRRKARSLWRPYRAFSRMMDMDPATKRDEIVTAAADINKQLSDYDALSRTKRPSEVVAALAKAEQALHDVATNKNANPADILVLLDLLARDVDQIKKDYEEVGKSADKVLGS